MSYRVRDSFFFVKFNVSVTGRDKKTERFLAIHKGWSESARKTFLFQ